MVVFSRPTRPASRFLTGAYRTVAVKHLLELLRRGKTLAWILVTILLALALTFALRRLPTLRIPFTVAAISVFLVVLLWLFPKWQVRSVVGLDSKDRFDCENEARKTLSQILGGLVLLIGFYFTWQNLQLTRDSQRETERIATEGQITDRFTKATTQLGDTKLEIRLGGIYALERIAKDSPKDHWPIMEVLTAYLREHAKFNRQTTRIPESPFLQNQQEIPMPDADIQAILTVLTRRTLTYLNGEKQRLDLRGTNLALADLSGADLSWADLTETNLVKADLSSTDLSHAFLLRASLFEAEISKGSLVETHFEQANLSKAKLYKTDLRRSNFGNAGSPGAGANLTGADLRGADLGGAYLRLANLQGALLDGANLQEADLTNAYVGGTDLSAVRGLSFIQLESAKGDASTKVPPNIARPKSWQ